MSQKQVLGEFHAKISKAKIIYNSTSQQNQRLKKQVAQLTREYLNTKKQRQLTQNWEKDMKHHQEQMERINKQQKEKCERQASYLTKLRKDKKQNQLQKTILQSQLRKLTTNLQQLVLKRTELQALQKTLSQKLSNSIAEKDILYQQHEKTKSAIKAYDESINNLKQQIKQMKQVITENTIPIHRNIQNKGDSQFIRSQQK